MKTNHKQCSEDSEDRVLIRSIVSTSDRQAMACFYQRYRKRLGSFLYRILKNKALVDEVYNDTMMLVWQKGSQYKGDSKVSTWVFTIAYRQCLAHKSKEAKHHAETLADDHQQLDTDYHLELCLSKQYEHQQLVNKALNQLSTEHRSVIELSYYLGFNYAEIGKISSCPENTVKTRMFHARRKLRDSLTTIEAVPSKSGRKESQ